MYVFILLLCMNITEINKKMSSHTSQYTLIFKILNLICKNDKIKLIIALCSIYDEILM